MFLFSDEKLIEYGLQRSKVFLGGRESPKIALPILDLIEKDPEWSLTKLTMQTLLMKAFETNSAFQTKFHPIFTRNQGIVQGLQNYHSWSNLRFLEMIENEDLLLELLANYLKRKIVFLPILNPIYYFQDELTFGDNFETEFNIVGYRYHIDSYYVSATIQSE